MTAGRPREHDRDQIAKELIEWAKQETSINLNGFSCSRNPPMDPSIILRWSKECDEFRRAYNIAKAFLAERRERFVSQNILHQRAYDSNLPVYDLFLKDEKRTQAEFESSLTAEADGKKQNITINLTDYSKVS